MPQITIEQTTFERLQSHAKPFVDTPDSVVRRALDALDGRVPRADGPSSATDESCDDVIDPGRLPDLKHTKVLAASINGELVRPANWSSLLRGLLVRAVRHFEDFDHVQNLCAINMVRGFKDDEGYKHLAEIEISYQGVSANAAANASVALAQALGVTLEVSFQWRRKQQAYRPGQKACLQLPGS